MGVWLLLLPIIVPFITSALTVVLDDAEADKPQPKPKPADPEPPADTGTATVPWEWILAIGGGVLFLAVVGVSVWYFGSRARHRLQEHKKAVAARAARQLELDNKWDAALKLHADLDATWHSYKEDLDAILRTPLMRNLSDPVVAAAVRAMGRARTLRSGTAPRLDLRQGAESASEYILAVEAYKSALHAAQQKAEVRGIDDFNEGDRDSIVRARKLLAMTLDAGASDTERQLAYDRVVKIVQKLRRLAVPKTAFARIELTSGVTAQGMIEAPQGARTSGERRKEELIA